ncbi:MAG: radical SAM protein [Desulfobacteraceae bacterium]|nr:MAG: radical SAM protein [Desulfobacteraceae bacterium]
MKPVYLESAQNGYLAQTITVLDQVLEQCCLCPRMCGVNRKNGETGICQTGNNAIVASFAPHFGEEPCISGRRGSGTIFFSGCSLMCSFCQNYDISHTTDGHEAEPGHIASIMLHLKDQGCHNINFVTPTHVLPQILEGLAIAVENGLDIPLVYNTSGFERVEILQHLEGIIDIYMPDFKFWNPEHAKDTCDAPEYPERVKKAVIEMHRQVGDLLTDETGIALSGLLVRHLVMPDNFSGTPQVLKFLKEKVSPATHVNVMSQYRPMGEVYNHAVINRPLSVDEFRASVDLTRDLGLNLVR